MLRSAPWTRAGNLAVVAVDHVLLTVHQLGAHAVIFRVAVLPAVTNVADRLDLMLIPQPLDQFAVVVALVGAQALALLQQVRVPLMQLIKQQLCHRLLPVGGRGDLECHRQLVVGVHDQVHQVSEPPALVLAVALGSPISVVVAAPDGLLVLRQFVLALLAEACNSLPSSARTAPRSGSCSDSRSSNW